MPRDSAILDLGRALTDHHHVRDASASLARGSSRLAHRAARAQIGGELAIETAASLDIERLVDRLGRHPHLRFVGEVDPESASDLLRTLVASESGLDLPTQPQARGQLRESWAPPSPICVRLSHRRLVSPDADGPLELTTDRRRMPADLTSDRSHA